MSKYILTNTYGLPGPPIEILLGTPVTFISSRTRPYKKPMNHFDFIL